MKRAFRSYSLILLVLFLATAASPAHAQFWDRVKDAAKDAATDVIEDEVRENTVKIVRGSFNLAENAVKCAVVDEACIERAESEGKTVVLTDGEGGVYVDENGEPISDPSKVPADMKASPEQGVAASESQAQNMMQQLFGGGESEPVELEPIASAPLDAPRIQYTLVTEMSMGGFGALGNLFGGGDAPETVVTYTENVKRTDDGSQSTIVDAAAGRYIILNHENQTYHVMTFEGMAERTEEALDELKDEAPGNEAAPESSAEFDMNFKRTGVTRTINGVPAEQVVLVMEVQNMTGGMEGTMYMVNEMWNSRQVAGYRTIERFNRQLGAAMQQQVASMAGMFGGMPGASNASMQASMEKAAEAMQEVGGLTVRQTTYMVMAPEGAELDLDRVLDASGGGQTSRTDGAPQAGGRQAGQRVMTRITMHVSGLHAISEDGDPLEIPSDYQKTEM